jgi:hypothetical protein
MTARSEVTPQEIEALLPAYRILLRIAREKKAASCGAAETPPPKAKAGAAPQAPARSSHSSTTVTPLTFGEDRRA